MCVEEELELGCTLAEPVLQLEQLLPAAGEAAAVDSIAPFFRDEVASFVTNPFCGMSSEFL